MIRQRGEVYFGLNTGTEFAEQIEDRNLSVTMTFIFVGVFLILTLNIFLSNYMNLKLPLLYAFRSISFRFISVRNQSYFLCSACVEDFSEFIC